MKPFFARGLFYDVVFEPTAQADAATLLVRAAPVKPVPPAAAIRQNIRRGPESAAPNERPVCDPADHEWLVSTSLPSFKVKQIDIGGQAGSAKIAFHLSLLRHNLTAS